MNTKNVGMYIHIPFCKHKCKYCDFKSYAGKEDKINEYIKWLKYEIAEVGIGNRMDFENGQDKLAIIDTNIFIILFFFFSICSFVIFCFILANSSFISLKCVYIYYCILNSSILYHNYKIYKRGFLDFLIKT